MLLIAAGRHSTELFLSHHPSSVIHNESLLNKYYIGDVEDEQVHLYDPKCQTDFYDVLRRRVEQYFKDNNLKPRDNTEMYIKTVILLFLWAFLYIKTHTAQNLFLATIYSCMWGLVSASIGTGIMHDANHGGYSNSATLNRVFGAVFDLLGGSSYCWKMIHSVGHHVSTNVIELDPDIHTNEPHFRRIKPTQKQHFWYKYQHIYLPFLYSTLLIEMFLRDFVAMIGGKWGGVKFQPITKQEWVIFFCCKALFLLYAFVFPAYFFHDGNWTKVCYLTWVTLSVASVLLVLIFQVNHVTDITEQFHTDNKERNGVVEKDWAKSQIIGSSNFASGSWLWNHLSGGLNHQTEHHLFPTICHVHYPKLHPIVKKTCEEYGVRFNSYSNFATAVGGHFGLLKKMGEQGYEYRGYGIH